jgi:hypothetical protein
MPSLKKLFLFFCLLPVHSFLNAQDKLNIKFGKVNSSDFDISKYKFDSGAAAVVIADMGDSHYEGNNIRGFRLIFKHYRRVKILNKNGFDIATVQIPIYIKGTNGQQLFDIKATTYNIESGQVTETKLDDKSVFTENYSRDILLKKFTFPGLKEGSIIEYSYTLQSAAQINLQPWDFQGKYPCFWSEYNVSIPEFFNYVTLTQGTTPYFISATTNIDEYGFKATQHRWVIKDVPALNEEKYTTTINNYISKVEFQLSSLSANGVTRNVVPGWPKIAEELMNSENFGADITKNNGWLDDDLKTIIQNTTDKLEKAQKIYSLSVIILNAHSMK